MLVCWGLSARRLLGHFDPSRGDIGMFSMDVMLKDSWQARQLNSGKLALVSDFKLALVSDLLECVLQLGKYPDSGKWLV